MTSAELRDHLWVLAAAGLDPLEHRPDELHEADQDLGSLPPLIERFPPRPREDVFDQASQLGEPREVVEGRAAPEPMRNDRQLSHDRQVIRSTADARPRELTSARGEGPYRLPGLTQED